ncbi:MAG: biopolymer transporter ExbD [Victivallales bacterium]|nr:biopolymer transporter ExbD [Victivallales bacterium]
MTPLMDLTFMLLIVFVITVPVMEYATDVTPPELNGDRRLEEESTPLVIALSDDGNVIVNEMRVPLHELTDFLVRLRQVNGPQEVMIRADGSRAYSEVIALMRAAKQAGMSSVSLMTQAEKAK